MIAASAFPLGGNAQFGSKPSKANRLLGFEQPAAAGCNSAAGKSASTKNLNNLLADDGDDGKDTQGEQPGLIQQLLNFFFSKLWSPATSDAEKLGWTYVYAEDGSLLAEYGEGSAATSGSAQYLWLPTANGPMPIAAVVNGQTYAVHSDHLNTPRKLTQANGQAVWQWAYSAFGDEQPTTAAKRFTSEMTVPTTGATSIPDVTFNLRYPGQYFDKETGLHYNWHRSYCPGCGRYTQADPIGLDGGWNRFSYVEGNPLSKVDPTGRFAMIIPFIPVIITGTDIAIGAGLGALGYGLDLIFNRPKNPPDIGPPGGFIQGPRRGRDYCPDGTPQTDYDRPHQGAEYPHIHDWVNGSRDDHNGRPYSPWPAGNIPADGPYSPLPR